MWTVISLLWGWCLKKTIIYKWNLVINLFRWLTVQTTAKINSVPCNCACMWKHFLSMLPRLLYNILLHISAAIMNGWNRDVCPSKMHLICWRPFILSFQHFWVDRFNFSRHLINICLQKPYYWLLHSHFWLSIGKEKTVSYFQ